MGLGKNIAAPNAPKNMQAKISIYKQAISC